MTGAQDDFGGCRISLDGGPAVPVSEFRAAMDAAVRRGRPPMKHDTHFDEAADAAYAKLEEELRSFVERLERLEAEKAELAEQRKEVMAEAKGRGFDTKILGQLVRLRKRDPADVAEEQAMLDTYKAALGM